MRGDLSDVPASRLVLLGCGFAFLAVGLAAFVFLWKADGLLAQALAASQPQVESRLPAALPEEERTRLAWAFDDAVAAVDGGWADEEALARVQERLALLREDAGRRLDRDEVAALTADLEAVSGRRPAAGASRR